MSMPKQVTFNRVVEHLRNQGEKSLNDRHLCSYRGRNGLKCAVGCLIPDEKYDPSFEGQDASYAALSTILKELGHDVRLCDDLQDVHDLTGVTDWEANFKRVAVAHKLVYESPVITPKERP
jgi:hypothetical protein